MVVKEDELELGLLHEEHLRVKRGSGWLREKEGAVLYRKLISPGWCYQPGLMSLATVGFDPRAFSHGS
jgi:hypothetical protein